jgi:hypothetical protein
VFDQTCPDAQDTQLYWFQFVLAGHTHCMAMLFQTCPFVQVMHTNPFQLAPFMQTQVFEVTLRISPLVQVGTKAQTF